MRSKTIFVCLLPYNGCLCRSQVWRRWLFSLFRNFLRLINMGYFLVLVKVVLESLKVSVFFEKHSLKFVHFLTIVVPCIFMRLTFFDRFSILIWRISWRIWFFILCLVYIIIFVLTLNFNFNFLFLFYFIFLFDRSILWLSFTWVLNHRKLNFKSNFIS